MSSSSTSRQFQTFLAFIFGDYRNYYFDGISEDIFYNLSDEEKAKATDLLLDAIDKENPDERVVEAVGQFRIIQALPMLHDLYSENHAINMRLHAAWALYRLVGDPQYVDIFIKFIRETSSEESNFAREDAIRRLPEFGKNSKSVELLLELEDVFGIFDVFRGNPEIIKMININDPNKTRENWRNISKKVRSVLGR